MNLKPEVDGFLLDEKKKGTIKAENSPFMDCPFFLFVKQPVQSFL